MSKQYLFFALFDNFSESSGKISMKFFRIVSRKIEIYGVK